MVHDDTKFPLLQPDIDVSTWKGESCGWQLATKKHGSACNVSVSGLGENSSIHVIFANYTCVVGHKYTSCWQ